MASVRQASFAGGELAPSLWGRTDLARYGSGLRRCFNFFATKHGAVATRPGTKYLGRGDGTRIDRFDVGGGGNFTHQQGTHSYVVGGAKVKLVPFYWSDTDTRQNYVLEFCEKGIRFWNSGALVTLNGSPLRVATPYHAEDLYKLRWAQSGDILYLTCAGYQPATLTRTLVSGVVTWTFAAIDFSRPLPLANGSNPVDLRLDVTSFGVEDSGHKAKPWSLCVTEVRRDQRGLLYESAAVKGQGFQWSGSAWNGLIPYPQYALVGFTYLGVPSRYLSMVANNINNSPLTTAGTAAGWQSDTQYFAGSVVSYGGNYYIAIKGNNQLQINLNVQPDTNADWWAATSDPSAGAPWKVVTTWANGTPYSAGDLVSYTASGITGYYQSKSTQSGHQPPNATYWDPITVPQYVQVDFPTGDVSVPVYQDMPMSMWLGYTPNPPTSNANFVKYRIYAGRQGNYGLVGETTDYSFVWNGNEPDLEQSAPIGLNPFIVKNDNGSTLRTETPIAVTFFDDRLAFGGTAEGARPAFLFASAVGDYKNFDQRLYPNDADSLVSALAARRRELVRSMIGLERLLVFTDAGVWSVAGAGGDPISPGDVDARLHVDIGADWPVPLVIEGAVLWVRNKGTGVRGLVYDQNRISFQSQDLSMASEHLLLQHTVADWCYAEDPWGVVWTARDDGLLLSLTYAPDEQLWAWAQHQIGGPTGRAAGVVQSVCSIPEAGEDAVYLAITGAALAAWSSAVTYSKGDLVSYSSSNYIAIQPSTASIPGVPAWNSGTAYSAGNVVTYSGLEYVAIQAGTNQLPNAAPSAYWAALGSTYPAWDPTVTYAKGNLVSFADLANYVSLVDANLNSHPPSSNWAQVTKYWDASSATASGTGPAWILRMSSRLPKTDTNDQIALDVFSSFGVGGSGPDTITNSSLNRFNGMQVWVQYDSGEALGPFTCTSGSVGPVARAKPASTAYIGLPFTCELETLDLADGRSRQKVVTDVALEIKVDQNLAGALLVGEKLDDTNLKTQKVDTTTEQVRPQILGSWNKGGRVAIRVDKPLPLTVRGVTREVERGDG